MGLMEKQRNSQRTEPTKVDLLKIELGTSFVKKLMAKLASD